MSLSISVCRHAAQHQCSELTGLHPMLVADAQGTWILTLTPAATASLQMCREWRPMTCARHWACVPHPTLWQAHCEAFCTALALWRSQSSLVRLPCA